MNIKKSLIAIICCLTICIANISIPVHAETNTSIGWQTDKIGKKYIYNTKGSYCRSGYYVLKNANKMYRFDEDGYVMYRSSNGQFVKGIYYDKYGAVDVSTINPNSATFNTNTNFAVQTHWLKDSYGIKFIVLSNGNQWLPISQSLKIDGKTYWFNEAGYACDNKTKKKLNSDDYLISSVTKQPITHELFTVKVYTKGSSIKKFPFYSCYNKLVKLNPINK